MKINWDQLFYGKIDERTKAIAHAGDAFALRILLFALLFDVMYRAIYLKDPSWDIMGLVIAGGLISTIYQVTHKVFESKTHLIAFIIFAIIFAAVLAATLVIFVLPLIR